MPCLRKSHPPDCARAETGGLKMAEYIKRETALMKLMQDGCSAKNLQSISDIPGADVAPVVRCKDCKHLCVWNRKDIYAFCPKTNIVFLPFEKDTRTFFCGFGERKDGGAE